jgi:hypothetical protein
MKIRYEFEDMEGNELGEPNPEVTWEIVNTFVDFDPDGDGDFVFTYRIKPAKVQFIADPEHGTIVVVEEPDDDQT